ncbi:DUF3558 domain-containing protein [Nocardia sp. NPDC048505]|uniref:DUF3558 domain-containing protein n=1 Tax=unclassified Nocardia TaxID=2637762 RepID=UPI0033F1C8E9
MRIADVLRTVGVGAVVVGVVAACGPSKSVEGTAQPTTREAEIWNPCTQLSDEALRKGRMDPASKSVTTDPSQGPAAWRVCKWNATELPYWVTVFSTRFTQDDSRSNAKLTNFREVTVGPRKGLIYQEKSEPTTDGCYVSLPAEQGMIEVRVGKRSLKPIPNDPCDLAIGHAKDLEPFLPK